VMSMVGPAGASAALASKSADEASTSVCCVKAMVSTGLVGVTERH
jgi:phosphotransferase system  glucose/maltose/N-acetylglucosamine-specific IIC component